jgi:hypothetical protein
MTTLIQEDPRLATRKLTPNVVGAASAFLLFTMAMKTSVLCAEKSVECSGEASLEWIFSSAGQSKSQCASSAANRSIFTMFCGMAKSFMNENRELEQVVRAWWNYADGDLLNDYIKNLSENSRHADAARR